MEKRVRHFMKEHHLVEKGDRIVVGVSGGADSVCLLYLLNGCKQLFDLDLYVVHVNHGLRGKDADEDEAYVKQLCHKLGLHFHAYHKEVMVMSKELGLSLEEAGRKARYDAFLEESTLQCCNKVAVAHHMNDMAETVLFHLIRGTGMKGLSGIPTKRAMTQEVDVIRPLLCLKREEIEQYLQSLHIPYCIDATNFTQDYSRNKLRNHILPYMKEEINEGVVEHIAQAAFKINEINEYINHSIDQVYPTYVTKTCGQKEILLKRDVLKEDKVLVKGMIRKIFSTMLEDGLKDIETIHVEQVMNLLTLRVGKKIDLPGGLKCYGKYEEILFTFSNEESNRIYQESMCIPIDVDQSKKYELKEIGKTLVVDVINYEKNMIIPKNTYTKWFDYDKIIHTIFVRTRQQGDYLQVNENGGKKKIKDYFIDQKIPKEERSSKLLLADGNHIMWVFDGRVSEAYKVSAETKKILVVSLVGGSHENG